MNYLTANQIKGLLEIGHSDNNSLQLESSLARTHVKLASVMYSNIPVWICRFSPSSLYYGDLLHKMMLATLKFGEIALG